MSLDIIRRFDVRVDAPDRLDTVDTALRAAILKQEPGQITIQVIRVERPPMLKVRLKGGAPEVASVKNSVEQLPGVRIFRDALEPSGAPGGTVYPDRGALLRIEGEPGPIARAGPRHKDSDPEGTRREILIGAYTAHVSAKVAPQFQLPQSVVADALRRLLQEGSSVPAATPDVSVAIRGQGKGEDAITKTPTAKRRASTTSSPRNKYLPGSNPQALSDNN